MSATGFSEIVRFSILDRIDEYEEKIRHEMNQELTVMEITPLLLERNFDMDKKEANEAFDIVTRIIDKNPRVKNYDPNIGLGKSGLGYNTTISGNSYLLIARNFSSLRGWLTRNISNDKRLKPGKLGIHRAQLTDEEGVLEFNEDGSAKIGLRSKFDIGHTVGIGNESKNAVAAARAYDGLMFAKSTDTSKAQKKFLGLFKKAHSKYKGNFKKTAEVTKNLVKSEIHFVYTVLQESSKNQSLGAIEKRILNDLKKELRTGTGSKPLYTVLNEQYDALFFGRKVTKYKSSAVVSGTRKTKKPKISVKTHKGKKPVIQRSRSAQGRFQSLVSLQNLLQPLITARVKHNMDHASYFKTRTGQFTRSVKIGNISMTDTNVMQIPYKYDKNPYEDFEKGGTWDSTKRGRDTPSTIIDHAVREVALELVYSKFNITTVGT